MEVTGSKYIRARQHLQESAMRLLPLLFSYVAKNLNNTYKITQSCIKTPGKLLVLVKFTKTF